MNPAKDCPGLEDLAAYLEGLPEGPARERIESHLASCADCRGEVRGYSRLLQDTEEAKDVPPPGFSAGLLRAAGIQTHRRTAAPRKPVVALALAAAVLLVAAGMAFFWPKPVRLPPPASVALPDRPPLRVAPAPEAPPPRPEPSPVPVPPRAEPRFPEPVAPAPSPVPPPKPEAPKPEPLPAAPVPAPPGPVPDVKPAPAPTRTAVAQVHAAEGKVVLLSGAEATPCVAKAEVFAGSGIQTGPKSSAVVVFPDGTRLELAGGTTVRRIADQEGQGDVGKRVDLEAGAIEAQVVKQPAGRAMVFITPHSEARVLGTSLRIAVIGAKESATRLEVMEGKVRLRRLVDGKTVDVASGHFAVAGAGGDLAASRVSSLVLHWKLDDAKGLVAQDASGNGNDGIVEGEPDWVAGRMAGAIDLMKARVDSPALGLGGELKSFTAAFWVLQETFPGYQDAYFQLIPGVSLIREANLGAGRLRVTLKTDGPSDPFSYDAVFTKPRQWTHVALTWDGALAVLYRNGRDVAKAKVGGRLLAPDGFIVRLGGSPKIDAKLDDVRLFRRALSEAEIRDVMVGGTVR